MKTAFGILWTHIIVIFFTAITCYGQTENDLIINKCARIEAGVLFGGIEFDDETISKPGGTFTYTYGFKPHNRIGLGIGSGWQFIHDETFVPIYIDLIGFLRPKKNTSFVELIGGYSIGWSNDLSPHEGKNLRGGLYSAISLGEKIISRESFCLYASCSYRFQIASIDKSTATRATINENLYYQMFSINIGLMLEQ